MSSYAAELLRRQYMGKFFVRATDVMRFGDGDIFSFFGCVDLARNPPDGVSVGLGEDENIFNWELLIVGPPDTLYEGGFFTAKLDFPADFPNSPPVMTFKTPIWHPNGKRLVLFTLLRHEIVETVSFCPMNSLRRWSRVHFNPPPSW